MGLVIGVFFLDDFTMQTPLRILIASVLLLQRLLVVFLELQCLLCMGMSWRLVFKPQLPFVVGNHLLDDFDFLVVHHIRLDLEVLHVSLDACIHRARHRLQLPSIIRVQILSFRQQLRLQLYPSPILIDHISRLLRILQLFSLSLVDLLPQEILLLRLHPGNCHLPPFLFHFLSFLYLLAPTF